VQGFRKIEMIHEDTRTATGSQVTPLGHWDEVKLNCLRMIFSGEILSMKIAVFILTAMRTSNPTNIKYVEI
jgi:hypothetical protein